jgi:hypothetical protein
VKPPASLGAAREAACARVAAAFPLERIEAKQAKKRDAWQAGLATTDVQLDSYLHADKRPANSASSTRALPPRPPAAARVCSRQSRSTRWRAPTASSRSTQ